MEFIKIILQHSNIKESNLYSAALKAVDNPEIGITIEHKSAYHVIKDCANVAVQYLPHLVFGSYRNPFETLKGKFTKDIIAEFIEKSHVDSSLDQLLSIIIDKADKLSLIPEPKVLTAAQKFDINDQSPNPYGDYGMEQTPKRSENTFTAFDILCHVFAA